MRIFSIALCFGVLATSGWANSGYYCEIRNTGDGGGFINSPIVVIVENAKKSATIIDPLILNVVEQPVAARTRNTISGALGLNWTVRNVPTTSGSKLNVSFSAQLDEAAGTIKTRARLANYQNHETANGKCRALTEQEVKSNNWLKR